MKRFIPLGLLLFALCNWSWNLLGNAWYLDLQRHRFTQEWSDGQSGTGVSSEWGWLIISWQWNVSERAGPFVLKPDTSLGPSLFVGRVGVFNPAAPNYNAGRLNGVSAQARMGSGFNVAGFAWAWEPAWSANRPFFNRGIAIRWWWLIALGGTPQVAAMASRWRRRQRAHTFACPSCGYDLRATPDRCPECGTLVRSPGTPGEG